MGEAGGFCILLLDLVRNRASYRSTASPTGRWVPLIFVRNNLDRNLTASSGTQAWALMQHSFSRAKQTDLASEQGSPYMHALCLPSSRGKKKPSFVVSFYVHPSFDLIPHGDAQRRLSAQHVWFLDSVRMMRNTFTLGFLSFISQDHRART